MRILRYECASGISGDMNLSALIDLGVDINSLVRELEKLGLEGWQISATKAEKKGIWGTQIIVDCLGGTTESHCAHSHNHHEAEHSHKAHCNAHSHNHHGRSFADIKKLIEESALSDFVKRTSIKIFLKLAQSEAKIHNKSVDDVHFHEVGAVDSIIDIVGSAVCLEMLQIDSVSVGEIELGGGFAKCEHGVIPVPAPATSELSQGFKCSFGGVNHEATTPTGMAFLATLAESSSSVSGTVLARGIGVGQRDCSERANILQVMLIENQKQCSAEEMSVVCANIDDMTAETVAFLCEKLFEAGAVDVWQESIVMKKSRLAVKVCALVHDAKVQLLEEVFFKNSTTLGVRRISVARTSLPREEFVFSSSLGDVRFKCRANGDFPKVEFDDIAKIAREKSIPFASVKGTIESEYKNSKS